MIWKVTIGKDKRRKTFNLNQADTQKVLKRAGKLYTITATATAMRATPKGKILYGLEYSNGQFLEAPISFLLTKREGK